MPSLEDIEDIMKKVHNPKLVKNRIHLDFDIIKLKEYVNEIIYSFKDTSNIKLSKLLSCIKAYLANYE